MNAKEARKLCEKHEKRQKEINKLIERGNSCIKTACNLGRRHSNIYAGYVIDKNPEYQEVLEHFKKLGYELKYVYGTNIFEIRW